MSAPSSGITPNEPVSLPRLIDIDSGHFWKSDVGEGKLTDTVFYVGSFAEIIDILTQSGSDRNILNRNNIQEPLYQEQQKVNYGSKTYVNQRNLKTS